MIKIENLTYRFPDGTEGLRGINLSIKKGEFVALLGRNGSGKSTLLRHLNGLLRPSEGNVFVKGLDSTDSSKLLEIRQAVGMVFQNPATQFVGTTLEEDVAFGLENLALPPEEIRKRVDRALAEVGLEKYTARSSKALSGGQQQCAAIASVLAMKPECLVFDEVTSMLDPESRALVLQTVGKLRGKGRTIVYVTHRLEEVLAADRVIVMDGGKIVREGKPEEVFKPGKEEAGDGIPDSGSDPISGYVSNSASYSTSNSISGLGLEAFGLKLPPVVELLNGLKAEGFFPDWSKLTSNESLAEEIWASLSKT